MLNLARRMATKSPGRSKGFATSQRPNRFTIGLIPADGIGREVIPAAQHVMEAVAPRTFSFIHLDAGFELFQKTGVALPPVTVERLRKECQGALFGAVSSPSHKVAGYSSPIVALRKKMDLYANVRPVANATGAISFKDEFRKPIDMVIVRENTECLYIKSESLSTLPNGLKSAHADRLITEYASRRIAKVAFNLAVSRGKARDIRRAAGENVPWKNKARLTIVHKSNVLSVTDGLFREIVRSEAVEGVDVEEQLVDSMVYRLFREPHTFDVVVAPNLYGDIISDGAAALVGSLGVVASANLGDEFCIGEPVHGSAPDIAGRGIANPVAAIRSAGLLMEHLGMAEEAMRIYQSVDAVLKDQVLVTPDLGGQGTTLGLTKAIVKGL